MVQVPRKLIGTDAFQETPIVEVTRQITKHNYLVMDLADLPRIMKEARCPLLDPCLLASAFCRPLGKFGGDRMSGMWFSSAQVQGSPCLTQADMRMWQC